MAQSSAQARFLLHESNDKTALDPNNKSEHDTSYSISNLTDLENKDCD